MSYADDFRHLEIQLEDIKAATNNFSDKPIGTGGFGTVYKGELLLPKGRRLVAFKRLNRKFGQGDVEFWKEITTLSELNHENLASLLHFCREGDERILIYEYVSHQSLDDYLGNASLTWIQRLHICIGAARGIAYLHDPKKTQRRILHRDIKSSNILLDDEWSAKVSDFGLSKVTPANQTRSYLVSNVAGTLGYCDPEYHATGILSKECDVYSFGVVLFEVMCGRLCCEMKKDKLIRILVHTWKKCYDEHRLDDIIFPDLKQQINQESLSCFANIARQCLNRNHKERPNMDEVVKELETSLYHQQQPLQHKAGVAKKYWSPQYDPYHLQKLATNYHVLTIGLKDIKLATNNFSTDKLIGHGGFGRVYKGELYLLGGRRMVCFKRLDHTLGLGDTEFIKEIALLFEYKHENMVSLLKFCNEGGEKILVYNYASHGSLDRHLSEPSLTWIQRLKICVGVAHAMNYLHDPQDTIHRDIRSSNILLDEEWTAKVSDFGLSKIGPANQPPTFKNAVGTPGYCDPVYFGTGFLTKESDVYSFGVVLFELMCGKLCFEYSNGCLTQVLVSKWKRCYDEKRLDEIIFSDLKKQMDANSLSRFSTIAYQCLKRDRKGRPTMAEVLKELEIALELQEEFEEMIIIQNLVKSPISKTSPNQNLMRFPKGVLVEDGNRWVTILKGKVSEVISATKSIYGSEDTLVHDNTQLSRFPKVLKGVMHDGFTVKATTRFLTPKVMYSVSLIFKHSGTDHGTHIPFEYVLKQEKFSCSKSCMTHVRDDGWLMTELHQFTSHRREHILEISVSPLFDITASRIYYFLEGIEFRPIRYLR